MTDAELNRAVADACGIKINEGASDSSITYVYCTSPSAFGSVTRFDPVNDWSDCGPLIEEFRLSIAWGAGRVSILAGPVAGEHQMLPATIKGSPDAELRRAICESVVKLSEQA